MTQTVTCCYCGRETSLQGQRPHQERCLYGPMGERVKAFCREYVTKHGRITTREWELNKERRALGLPNDQHITRSLGSWPVFIEWCGLEYKRTSRNGKERSRTDEIANFKRIDAMLAEGKAALESAYDFRAIPVVRQYTERYRDLDTGEVHDRYVMVLR